MVNTDYIEIDGPDSLNDLLGRLNRPAVPVAADIAIVELVGEVYAAVQYDEVDIDTWPYMITVESRSDDEEPVRAAALALLEQIKPTGWRFRVTSDSDDSLLIEGIGGGLPDD